MSVKINRVTATGPQAGTVNKTVPKGTVSFSQLMGDKEDEHDREHLKEMYSEIQKKGKQLAENRTIETLLEYKEMIKGFVEKAVHFGLKIEERRGLSRSGRSRMMKIVSAVDEGLLELTNMVLDQEQAQIRLLEKIGQIQGMLVNMIV